MLQTLPDPRVFVIDSDATPNPLLDAAQHGQTEHLRDTLQAALAGGDDVVIRAALQGGPPPLSRRVWDALAAAMDAGGDVVGLQFFALPVVLIAGARTRMTVPGMLPEIGRISELLEQHGAVGATRNFGMGNALSGADAVESLSYCALWRARRDPAAHAMVSALVPEPVAVLPGREQVHLRFLTGAGITPPHLPSFLESAAHIGAWGMPLTRELARQLAQPGLEVLPLPRPPRALVRAAHAGRRAQLEAALDLFLGNIVRHFRISVGDPEAVLSAHRLERGAGELRLSLGSPFDASLLEGFCWPLHPLDDIDEVATIIRQAVAACRITGISSISRILPDRLPGGFVFVAPHVINDIEASGEPH